MFYFTNKFFYEPQINEQILISNIDFLHLCNAIKSNEETIVLSY